MNIPKYLPYKVKSWVRKQPLLINTVNTLDGILHHRELSMYTDIVTMISTTEREYLYKLAKDTQGIILCIGTYAGGSTYFLGKGAEKSGAHIYSIDPFHLDIERQIREDDGMNYWKRKEPKPPKKEVEETFKKHGLEDKVTLIEGFSTEIAEKWNYGKISILFIDGNHKQVFQDFYAWKKHLAPDAIVAFHDSNDPEFPDVKKAVEDIINREKVKIIGKVDSITAIKLS